MCMLVFFWFGINKMTIKGLFVDWLNYVSDQRYSFDEPATEAMERIIDLHHWIVHLLVFIVLFVLVLVWFIVLDFMSGTDLSRVSYGRVVSFVSNTMSFRNASHNSVLEFVWTVLPTIFLVIVAVPSFTLLYNNERIVRPVLTLKVIGHQWYWAYEYALNSNVFAPRVPLASAASIDITSLIIDTELSSYPEEVSRKLASLSDPLSNLYASFSGLHFDSNMKYDDDLRPGLDRRLLSVDKVVVLPKGVPVMFLITAADVLHSWAVPALGIKMDAIPGRLNQVSTILLKEGVFWGQCSELCGVNHGFMPIQLVVLPLE